MMMKMMPLCWLPMLLSVLLLLLANGCSAMLEARIIGANAGPVLGNSSSSNKNMAILNSKGSKGATSGGNQNSVQMGAGARNSGSISASNAGARLGPVRSISGKMEGVGENASLAEKIEQEIKKIYSMNGHDNEKNDAKSISVVLVIFKQMPLKLQQKRAKMAMDAGIAQIALDRFKALAKEHAHGNDDDGHKERETLAIFNTALDIKLNLGLKVEKEIEYVESAIEFYQLRKDPDGHDVVQKSQPSEVESEELEAEMDAQKLQMIAFLTWLKKVSTIVANHNEDEAKCGPEIYESLCRSPSPLSVNNNGVSHGEKEAGNGNEKEKKHHSIAEGSDKNGMNEAAKSTDSGKQHKGGDVEVQHRHRHHHDEQQKPSQPSHNLKHHLSKNEGKDSDAY